MRGGGKTRPSLFAVSADALSPYPRGSTCKARFSPSGQRRRAGVKTESVASTPSRRGLSHYAVPQQRLPPLVISFPLDASAIQYGQAAAQQRRLRLGRAQLDQSLLQQLSAVAAATASDAYLLA